MHKIYLLMPSLWFVLGFATVSTENTDLDQRIKAEKLANTPQEIGQMKSLLFKEAAIKSLSRKKLMNSRAELLPPTNVD